MRLINAGLLLITVIAVVGCAVEQQARIYPPATFEHRVATSQVEVYWTCSEPEAGVIHVSGVATNPWNAQPVRYFELEVAGVDANGRTVSAGSGGVPDVLLHTNQISPFRVLLRRAGTEARYDLYYQYQYNEMEFESALFPFGGPISWATHRFMVRDACAAGKHRAR